MRHWQLLLNALLISSLFTSLPALASKNTINITVDNQSHRPYSLTIYGKGANYDVRDAFSSLPAHQSGNIQISYQIKGEETEPQIITHTIVLSSPDNKCAVDYSTHCQHNNQNYLANTKLKAKVHAATGPCQASEEDENTIRIVITEELTPTLQPTDNLSSTQTQ